MKDNRFSVDAIRETNGKLPAFAWPGGYEIIYVTNDGGTFCHACANGENGSRARTVDGPDDAPRDGWKIMAYDILYEGSETCDHCGKDINAET